jgi:maltose/moltooligosaccharide transporter
MAAGLLWVLDASINISMEPFRAFVADLLPEKDRTRGFAMQALFIGLGAVVASMLPWLLSQVFHVGGDDVGATIPRAVTLSFYIGAAMLFGSVLWTIVTTKEHPPEDMTAFRKATTERSRVLGVAREIASDVLAMPETMRRLAWVQLFTWLGLFSMWLFFGVAVARNIFGGTPGTPAYEAGIAWGGNCFAAYSAVCFVFSFALPALAKRYGRKRTHAMCLLAGAVGLVSVAFVHDKYVLLLSMLGVGVAWASTLSMPYAMVAGSLPREKTGVYMGIFNFFIVIPEIAAAVAFGPILEHVLTEQNLLVRVIGGDNRLAAVVIGGMSLAVASGLALIVKESPQRNSVCAD